jgi:hypothetical protein
MKFCQLTPANSVLNPRQQSQLQLPLECFIEREKEGELEGEDTTPGIAIK